MAVLVVCFMREQEKRIGILQAISGAKLRHVTPPAQKTPQTTLCPDEKTYLELMASTTLEACMPLISKHSFRTEWIDLSDSDLQMLMTSYNRFRVCSLIITNYALLTFAGNRRCERV